MHAASWFRHLASAGASLFARIRKADPVFLAMPFVLLVLILLFVLRLRYVRRIRRERSRKALEHRRRTYEELVREFTEDPKDEEFSIDELLLTIDELQKEEQEKHLNETYSPDQELIFSAQKSIPFLLGKRDTFLFTRATS